MEPLIFQVIDWSQFHEGEEGEPSDELEEELRDLLMEAGFNAKFTPWRTARSPKLRYRSFTRST